MKKFYDVVFVGAGLANGLAALRLNQVRPDVEFLVLEASERFGGNHTWSFHESDLSPADFAWVHPLVSKSWEGTDVRFPAFRRTVGGRYHAIRSSRLHEILSSTLHYQIGLKNEVKDVYEDMVVLKSGFQVKAGCVVDGRGWPAPADVTVGYQKFIGIEIELKNPHGLERPVIMDATFSQDDGFRFFYILPWTATSVLIEDTRYSDGPALDEAALRREILGYAVRQGWDIAQIGREEQGALPIPLDGPSPVGHPGVVYSGLRAGLFHATTGYSLPDAVRFASELTERSNFHGPHVAAWADQRAHRHWRNQRFFRFLNRLLFRAAPPHERYKVLQSFYRRPDPLIARFYAGRLGYLDRLRLLSGVPPVPVHRAFREIFQYASAN